MAALGDFSSGDVLTAADLNAIGDWVDYTPALEASTTDPTYTSADGLYYELNEIVFVRWIISGFTSAGSGTYYVTMPTDVISDLFPVGFGLYSDGNTRYSYTAAKSSSGARRLFMVAAHDQDIITNSDPFTPGSGDFLRGMAIYRQA